MNKQELMEKFNKYMDELEELAYENVESAKNILYDVKQRIGNEY